MEKERKRKYFIPFKFISIRRHNYRDRFFSDACIYFKVDSKKLIVIAKIFIITNTLLGTRCIYFVKFPSILL